MDVLILFALIIFNGLFSMAEIAIVSSRRGKLKTLAQSGDKKAIQAAELAEKPAVFFSTVQIGITLVTVLAGAFGESRFVAGLSEFLGRVPFLMYARQELAFIIVIAVVTYLSIVIGELVPKRMALSNPEHIARLVAPYMYALSRLTGPIIRFLELSTNLVFRLIGFKPNPTPSVSEDEIRTLIREGAETGVLSRAEIRLIERAFVLDELRVSLLMTPKHQMTLINVYDFIKDPQTHLKGYPYSRIILTEGSQDVVFGVVHAKDLLTFSFEEEEELSLEKVKTITVQPHLVPESTRATKVLEMFRHSAIHIALVIDEFGSIQGLVTLNDILEALVGDIQDQSSPLKHIIRREDGSFLVDGGVSIYDLKKKLIIQALRSKDLALYQTAAGFMIAHLDKVPTEGDYFERYGYRFEVVDMDKNRVDKVLVRKIEN
ncbi:MAG TPA: hemolysin family protein [Candidatus Woesebacteria bacterium]|nr:hemolysin family protein [Candidatus Woesebacteria bacterium]HNS94766.1 hemolysin family protein [Candidatus Woesebacteria bacterium]